MTIPPNTTLGHYKIVPQIGEGGMGEVYLAVDTRLRRKVALKVLPEIIAADSDRLRRFEREAFAASALNHPNILTIYEFGEEHTRHFLVSEFVDGESLRQRITRTSLSLTETLEIAIQIVSALQVAHQAGIVHRDIKPDNVMIRADRYVKVLNFGLAKLTGSPALSSECDSSEDSTQLRTQAGMIVGTAAYMAPEQARGQEVDARTDIWSFGCLLYEMITGHQPFKGETTADALANIIHREPVPIEALRPDVPAELQRISHQTLKKDKTERYQTATDLLADLRKSQKRLEFKAELEDSDGEGPTQIIHQQTISGRRKIKSIGELPFVRKAVFAAAAVSLILLLSILTYRYLNANRSSAIDSIAVLPFQNTSGDPNNEYLSDGVTETTINSLSRVGPLRVMARSTMFRFKGRESDPQTVGRELGVQAVMTGRILQQGDDLTISVEVVNVADGTQLWGQQYKRHVAQLANVQQEIASDITAGLRLKLTGDPNQLNRGGSLDSEAYQAYLRGRYYLNKRSREGIEKAIQQFQEAIGHDQNYAAAYTGLADSYSLMEYYGGSPTSEMVPKAKAAIDRALQIDNSLAEAHTSLAAIYEAQWKWSEAEEEYKRAINLNPNYSTAHLWYHIYLRAMRRFDEALAEAKRAKEIDPLSPIIAVNLTAAYFCKGDLDAALREAQRLEELEPNSPLAHVSLAHVYIKQGRYAEAISLLEKNVAIDRTAYSLSRLGHAKAVAGKREQARAIIGELEEKYNRREAHGHQIAIVQLALGDFDQTFAWLEKDVQAHASLMASMMADPFFDPIRSDARYAKLMRRIGII